MSLTERELKPSYANILFICGLHRSGTSMLHSIIRQHPDVSGFNETGVPEDEGQHLQNIIPTARAFGGPGQFCFDSNARMDETHELCTAETAASLFDQWKPYWDISSKLLVEKSPPNLIRMRFLQGLFPHARFLILLRNPIAVAYATRKFIDKKKSIKQLLNHSILGYQLMAKDLPHLNKAMVIRYEELVQKPDEILTSLFDFLSLSTLESKHPIRSGVNAEYFKLWELERKRLIRGYALRQILKDDSLQLKSQYLGYSLKDNSICGAKSDLEKLAAL